MVTAEEIRKTMESYESEKAAILLESLDESSKILAKTYLSALLDKQNLEKRKVVG